MRHFRCFHFLVRIIISVRIIYVRIIPVRSRTRLGVFAPLALRCRRQAPTGRYLQAVCVSA
ncbi:MAG: hypothetical protein IIT83_09565, partial [Bacteroidales bacterium]|nr:hypothetical protein [Bacteroidales bacterium]